MLHYIFCLLSLALTGVVYFFESAVSYWWALPIFLGFLVAFLATYLIGLWIASQFLSKKDPIDKPSNACRFMIWLTMDWLMAFFRVRIKFIGRELLPDEPTVLVSNHISDFDPMTVLAVLRDRKPLYISKEANFRIPIVGKFIHRAGFLAIDRENAMRAMRTIKRASDMMKEHRVDMGIYPEGTRSKTGELLEFKSGAFLLAKKANAPIAVMTTEGTDRFTHNLPFRATRVTLTVHEIITAERVAEMSLDEISAYVRARIEQELSKNK